jgi:ribosome-interacting GTPase 1
MPTNLPPEYYEVDKRYRVAKSDQEKISLLVELISTVPKHKGTEKLRATLSSRLAKLREASQSRKKISRQASSFQIEPEGAGQVVVIGTTNVGKSALVEALTNATPEVSESPFTTWTPTPGMLVVENVQIQLVDTPPLDRDYLEPELLELIRNADLLLLVVDLQTDPIQQLKRTMAVLEANRIQLLDLAADHPDCEPPGCLPLLVAVNKCDDRDSEEVYEIFCQLMEQHWSCQPVSATTGYRQEDLKHAILDRMGVIRIYAKPPGKDPDMTVPFVMARGSTVIEFASQIHQDFLRELKSARVWGSGVFDGQTVGRDHVLHDGDIVELRRR